MKTIKINDREYQLEFSFEAAEHRGLVQKMFNMLSGAYIAKHASETEEKSVEAVVDGTSEMVAEVPHVCITAFHAGLLEHNPVSEEESKELMKAYMRENKISYRRLYEELKECMEEDGFFDLSGLTEMIQTMEGEPEAKQKTPKTPQDHKKKSTGTK